MKQVVQSAKTGKLTVRAIPELQATAGHVLVRTAASLISAGTERMVVDFAQKNLAGKAKARPDLVRKVMDKAKRDGIGATIRAVLARLDEPLPLGYSASGEVVGVGQRLEGRFRVGQRVAIAGAGMANHAEFNLVPGSLAVPVPDDVNDEEACFGTLGAIALHGVRNMNLELGDWGAVIGVGLVGQLAVQFLDLAGVRVIALDYDSSRLELARYGGAELTWNLADGGPVNAILERTKGLGCDGILIAAATESSEPLKLAGEIARDRARISLVGSTGTEFPFRDYMAKELSVTVSRSYGPGRYDRDFEQHDVKYPPGFVRWTETRNLDEAVRLMSRRRDRRLAVEQLITHRFAIDDAENAYGLVIDKSEPHLGVVLGYPQDQQPQQRRLRVPAHISPARHTSAPRCVLGVIGAGNFAKSVLLPQLKRTANCELHTIATRRALSAEHSQDRFGFQCAAADEAAVLQNPEINAVIIATPHASHAAMTATALSAGKHVLVEKPLALDHEGLDAVVKARNRSEAFFQVGFNRRFAPMAKRAHDRLDRIGGSKFVLIRVNAGALDSDSWVNAPEEGHGRILGEACHFIDLARYLIGAPIAAVHASAAQVTDGACDDVTMTVNFADGSLSTIAYTSRGDTADSKELIECYAGGTNIRIDDFRGLSVTSDGKTSRQRKTVLNRTRGTERRSRPSLPPSLRTDHPRSTRPN